MSTSTTELRRTYLMQRLCPPDQRALATKVDNPFTFGGGYRNGGLSDEAMALLRPILSFDYMGAAEYEFGDVPKSLGRLAQGGGDDLSTTKVHFPRRSVPRSWREPQKSAPPKDDVTLYVLARTAQLPAVVERVLSWVKTEPDVKGGALLHAVLRPYGEHTPDVCGWLEISNDFMVFTDEAMWRASAELMGVAP